MNNGNKKKGKRNQQKSREKSRNKGMHEWDKAKREEIEMMTVRWFYFLLTAAPSVGKSSVEAKFGFSFFDGR